MTPLPLVLYLISITLFSAIPFEKALRSLLNKHRRITAQLDKPTELSTFPKWPLMKGLIALLNISKGILPTVICTQFFDSDPLLIISSTIACIGLHNWSPFYKFTNQKSFFLPLWGFYSVLSPLLIVGFPVIYILLALIVNTFSIGLLISVFFISFLFGINDYPVIYLPGNFALFLLVFFSLKESVFHHIETHSETLLNTFKSRLSIHQNHKRFH